MSQPKWITPAGNLGTYSSDKPLYIKLLALPMLPASNISFSLISGKLPEGTREEPIRLDRFGNIFGSLKEQKKETKFTFTVRVTDEYSGVKDRTFSISVFTLTNPKIITDNNELLRIPDSTYVDFPIQYSNPITTNKVTFLVTGGQLPEGLQLTEEGRIKGYAIKPILSDKSPTMKTSTFTVELVSLLGNDTKTYSITIINQQLSKAPNSRTPVILNSRPLKEPIPYDDVFYDYYLIDTNKIKTVIANEFFSFKVLGYDFDSNEIEYQFGGLPTGLVGDRNTGWITGKPLLPDNTISKFTLNLSIAKKNKPEIVSDHSFYELIVTNGIEEDIKFVTDSNLGIILNGTISSLEIVATSKQNLNYRLAGGSLPPNLTLLENGQIVGRVSQQPTSTTLEVGDSTEYNFTVQAFSYDHPVLVNEKQFKLTVDQYYPYPVENLYLKANSGLTGKRIIKELLTSEELIPNEYLYRKDDPYFGKAKSVKIVHGYGIESSSLDQYLNAIQKNHYLRKIVLGDIETAIATDDKGNILYEVVYCKLVDSLVNDNGVTINSSISWPKNISLRQAPYVINNTNIPINNTSFKINVSPGSTFKLNPGSLENMLSQLTTSIGQNTDSRLLPKWMTTQQKGSSATLGFVRAWVICYTLPNKSEIIKSNILNWKHKLNEVEFNVDRFIVDKSATYNWNTNLAVPAWNELPSAVTPNDMEQYDLSVLFPRKTILPKDYQ